MGSKLLPSFLAAMSLSCAENIFKSTQAASVSAADHALLPKIEAAGGLLELLLPHHGQNALRVLANPVFGSGKALKFAPEPECPNELGGVITPRNCALLKILISSASAAGLIAGSASRLVVGIVIIVGIVVVAFVGWHDDIRDRVQRVLQVLVVLLELVDFVQ